MPKTQKSRKDLKPIEDKLRAELESLNKQISEIEARYQGEEGVVLGDDEGAAGSLTTDRERDLSLLDNTRDIVDQVERAIQRIEDGIYGKCASCGKSIEAARLKALPHASLCIACKRLEERH
jgi:RNA polymerase-binding protein DksA